MSDSTLVSGVLKALLCGVTGYGVYTMGPMEHPLACSACAIGFCHGALGLLEYINGDSSVTRAKEISTSVMEMVPLPLVNLDLYFSRGSSNNIALGHGMFAIPLAVSCLVGHFKGESSTEVAETLQLLTILGNITSLSYLAFNEGSWPIGIMAMLAFMAKYGAEFCEERMMQGSGMPINYLSWCGFFWLTTGAIVGDN